MLCDVCLDIFRGSFSTVYTEHHGSVQSLHRSVLEKCELCRIFWDEIPRMSASGSEDIQVSTKYRLSTYRDTSAKLLEFRAISPPYMQDWNIFCEPTNETGDGKSSDNEKSYDCSDWNASMTCAKTWLAECMENHSECPASRSNGLTSSETSHSVVEPAPYRPTRLLELGSPEAGKVRLRLSSELDSTASHYATLSHCWGKSKTLRLTSKSFQRFREGMSVTDLAKTFQNAISTAQSLGMKLLWIDSFCIFQDSKEDWAQEAGLMSQVYRNSFLNIAASIAVDSDAGFLRERASTVEPYVVQTTWTDHPNGTYYVYNESYWFENFERMPLNSRTWVFQETVLAPRILHFCGNQMFWECHGLKACETWPTGLPSRMEIQHSLKSTRYPAGIEIFGSKYTNGNELLRISTDKNATLNMTSFRSLWRKITAEYSQCNLTFGSDKLIALSGIAKHMEQLLDIEYCAGLWGHDIVQGLAWYAPKKTERDYIFQTEADPIHYRAPSWSWACTDRHIWWYGYFQAEGQGLVDVIRWEVQSATGDRTGAVIGATMQLCGYLATMELHPTFGTEQNFAIHCDGKWNSMDSHNFYFDRRPPSFQLHCMPLFIDCLGYLCALLLVPTRDTRGQFRRVGMFRTLFREKELVDWNQLDSFKNESWLEYESIDDEGKYTITII